MCGSDVFIPGLGAVWEQGDGSAKWETPQTASTSTRIWCTASGVALEGVHLVKMTRMRRASSEEELQWGRRPPGPATMCSLLPERPHVAGRPNPWWVRGTEPIFSDILMVSLVGRPFSGETNPEFGQGSDPRFSPWSHCQSSHGDLFPPWDWYLEVLWRGSPLRARSMGINGAHRKVTTKVCGAGVWNNIYTLPITNSTYEPSKPSLLKLDRSGTTLAHGQPLTLGTAKTVRGRSPQLTTNTFPTLSDAKSRLSAPTRSSLVKSKTLSTEEVDNVAVADAADSWRSKPTQPASLPASRQTSQSISPQEKSLASLPATAVNSPAVASRMRAHVRVKNTTSLIAPESVHELGTPARSSISPRGLRIGADNRFVVDPPLKSTSSMAVLREEAGSTQSPPSSPLTDLPTSPKTARTPEVSVLRPLLPGMERGFALSPMGELMRKYLEESDGENSLFVQTNMIISKKDLTPKDVQDRGIAYEVAFPRFNLEMGFSLRMKALLRELQEIIVQSANLIPSRRPSHHYVIDLHSALMGVLLGAESLDELTIAWRALRQRIELAPKTSRMPEIYDQLAGFDRQPSYNMPRVSYLYEHVPHLRETMPIEWRNEPSCLTAWIDSPTALKNAFPDRNPERRPAVVYYTQDGERRVREMSPSSSWKAPGDYVTPTMEYQPPRNKTPKRVSIAEGTLELRESTPEEYPQLETATNSSSGEPTDQDPRVSAYLTASLRSVFGSITPFKTAEEFFPVPKTRTEANTALQVPNTPLPNPLDGLAAPASYSYGLESISQAHRQPKRGEADI
ncbi:hypothetical protein DFH09DRAFT_1080698 [Mycena vulgaris]|nr:hypothetical protein DFH09DRAFT_1080698 [Mycena vulgaris]